MLAISFGVNFKGLYPSSEKKRKIDLVFTSERAQGTGKRKLGIKQRIENDRVHVWFCSHFSYTRLDVHSCCFVLSCQLSLSRSLCLASSSSSLFKLPKKIISLLFTISVALFLNSLKMFSV